MTRQIRDRPDEWYIQAQQELRLMELLDRSGPMTVEAITGQIGLVRQQVIEMLFGLKLAECVSLNRKSGKFSLVPVEVPEQLELMELG